MKIATITLLVKDYEEAIDFYVNKLNFKLIEDTQLNSDKRWVLVAPSDTGTSCLLLAKATDANQKTHVGNQAGGKVFLFLHTHNFWRDYERMQEKGIEFMEKPREETYGTVAVFKDLYGNLWDLYQSR